MKKTELVRNITEEVRGTEEFAVTQKETEAYLTAIKHAIVSAVISGDEVMIPGLVKFTVVDVPARTYRNPQTGEPINAPAKKKVKVKILSELKEAAN